VGRRQIRDILDGLTGKGVTVFINSHLLSEVESFCEYVAILNKGRLALEGRISSLLVGRGYSIMAAKIPHEALPVLKRIGEVSDAAESGYTEIQVKDREDLNRAIDEIRASGGLIEAVSHSTSSLEDVFIQATRSERAA